MSTGSQSPQPSPRTRSRHRVVNNAPRRGHTKSRLGCKTCKRRKVKCDESRPSCLNCNKHGVVCDFIPSHPTEASPDAFGLPFVGISAQFSFQSDGDAGAGASSPGIDLLDLELLHNFTTYTYATLGSDTTMRNMMKTTVIKMAVNCEYLMRTILALSALHLAHFRKEKTDVYVNRALSHHQVASRQATALMSELKEEDCENLHLFTVMTVFVALGFPRNADYSLLLGTSVIPDWLPLLTTSEPILQVLNPRTYRGRLAPIFSYGKARSRVLMRREVPPPAWLLSDLRALVNETCQKPEFLPVYNRVIDELRSILSLLVPSKERDEDEGATPASQSASAGQPPLLEAWDVLVWQWHFAEDFARLLRGSEPEQEAVAIYSHLLIMLKKLESQWWLEGWATHLMEKVWAVLDEEHRGWVQWPVEELGWVPP